MEFDGKQEALEREEQRNQKVTPIRPARGSRKQNKAAAKAEALNEGVKFEFDGKEYHLPPADQWDIEVMEHFSEGNVIQAAKALFEAKQWNEFKTDEDGNKVKRVNADLAEFIEVAMSALGVEPGESNS